MRLQALGLGLILSLSTFTSYAKTDAEKKGELEAYSTAVALAATEVNKINKDIQDLTKQMNDHKNSLKKYNVMISTQQYFDKDSKELEKKRDDAKAQIDELNKKLEVQQASLQKAQNDFKEHKSKADKAAQELSSINELRTDMSKMQVNQQIDQGKIQLLGADKIVNEIESTMDRGNMGIYLKDKIGQLINSQLMCEGVNRCIKGKAPMPIAPEKLNEIFKNKDTPTRSEYYYQLREQKAPGAQ